MRKPLWEMDCLTRDIVLALNFSPDELQGLLREEGYDAALLDSADEWAVYCFVHHRCDCPSVLARRIDALLRERHADFLHRTERVPLEYLTREDDLRLPEVAGSSLRHGGPGDLAAVAYALASSPDPDARRLWTWFRYSALVAGMRSLATSCRG